MPTERASNSHSSEAIGGAYTVYQQLKDEEQNDFTKLKQALYMTFGMDPFAAYQQFIGGQLLPDEMVDVYMADLWKLSVLFGDMNALMLGCAFVAGLPDDVCRLLQVTFKMDELLANQLLAQTIHKGAEPVVAAVTAARTNGKAVSQPEKHMPSDSSVTVNHDSPVCYKCGGPSHFARECQSQSGVEITSQRA